jgi:hypothetical protein
MIPGDRSDPACPEDARTGPATLVSKRVAPVKIPPANWEPFRQSSEGVANTFIAGSGPEYLECLPPVDSAAMGPARSERRARRFFVPFETHVGEKLGSSTMPVNSPPGAISAELKTVPAGGPTGTTEVFPV